MAEEIYENYENGDDHPLDDHVGKEVHHPLVDGHHDETVVHAVHEVHSNDSDVHEVPLLHRDEITTAAVLPDYYYNEIHNFFVETPTQEPQMPAGRFFFWFAIYVACKHVNACLHFSSKCNVHLLQKVFHALIANVCIQLLQKINVD
jgi:hypothetical protein